MQPSKTVSFRWTGLIALAAILTIAIVFVTVIGDYPLAGIATGSPLTPTVAPTLPTTEAASATFDPVPLQTQSAASTLIAYKLSDYLTHQAQPSATSATPNPAPTGIYDAPQFKAWLSKQGFDVTNAWVENGSGYDVIIYAGAYHATGESAVFVQWQLSDRLFEKGFSPAVSDGALIITAWQAERLTLVSVHGTVYYFDIAAMQFVASLTEVVPSATPLPTYTPSQPLPTPDFSTPTLAPPSSPTMESLPTGYPQELPTVVTTAPAAGSTSTFQASGLG